MSRLFLKSYKQQLLLSGLLTAVTLLFCMMLGEASDDISHGLDLETTYEDAVEVEVKPGASLREVLHTLSDKELIGNPKIMEYRLRLFHKDTVFKAGDYLIPKEADLDQILDILESGRSIQHHLTLPEGWTIYQIVQRINANETLQGERITWPVENVKEGYLLPETYAFSRSETKQEFFDRIVLFAKVRLEALEESLQGEYPKPLKSFEEVLNLAALVEKEAAIREERPIVASVYLNRLNKRMRLQADPTIIYGVTEGRNDLGRGILKSELQDKENPYNTYAHYGLPPTPISNPSMNAIESVLNPATTDYLFFVADGTGGHTFTTNYDDHRKAVAKWRKIEQNNKK